MRTVLWVDDVIALCHILDEFEEVNYKFLDFASKFGRDGVSYLWSISNGKFVLGKSKIHQFYQENKDVIDRINKYSSIMLFINRNYMGMNASRIFNMYEYIEENRNELDRILAFLKKVKKLGFVDFHFNSGFDFNTEECEIDRNIFNNWEYTFFEKIEVIPNYNALTAKYRANGSKYKIVIRNEFREIVISKELYVNNLLIDPDSLPNSINKEETFDKIISLSNGKKKENEKIRNLILLEVSLEDLIKEFYDTKELIEELNLYELKALTYELRELLNKIQDRAISTYKDAYGDVLVETFEKEKKLYLEDRKRSSFILD